MVTIVRGFAVGCRERGSFSDAIGIGVNYAPDALVD